jgi:formamidopyrimidine-DNA glycosylase
MPELPDVEVYKGRADERAVGREVRRIKVPEPSILDQIAPANLIGQLQGCRIQNSRRHGKFLFLGFDSGPWLVLHFGMTGRLAPFDCAASVPAHTDLLLELDEGVCIAYVATRKLGRITLTDDPDGFIAEQELGADALRVEQDAFLALAKGHRAGVKCWLMNQRVLAGLGNVYSDEVLYRARMHPKTKLSERDEQALRDLFAARAEVLRLSIEAGADPQRMPDDFLLPHREAGAQCPRCDGEITTLKVCGRKTYLCPSCQPQSTQYPAKQAVQSMQSTSGELR